MSPYILILVGSDSDPTSQRVVDEEGGECYLRSGSGIGPILGEVVTSLQVSKALRTFLSLDARETNLYYDLRKLHSISR